jgi:hypothetical protein
MINDIKVIGKWAVGEVKDITSGVDGTEICMEYKVNCFDTMDDIGNHLNEKSAVFRVYQIIYNDQLVEINGEVYYTHINGAESVKEEFINMLERDAMTYEEMLDYLVNAGYDIYDDNGELDGSVDELIAFEKLQHNEILDLWFK